jgi:flavin-binding protein dodecin
MVVKNHREIETIGTSKDVEEAVEKASVKAEACVDSMLSRVKACIGARGAAEKVLEKTWLGSKEGRYRR